MLVAEPLTIPDAVTTPAVIPDQDQGVAEQDEDVDAFLTSRSADAVGTEQGTEGRTDTEKDDVEEQARQAEIKAEAQRQAEALRKTEREAEAVERERVENERRAEGITAAYRNRASVIAKALADEGVTPAAKQAILTEFNEHHAQSLLYHSSNFTTGLYNTLAKRLPEEHREDFLALRPKHKSYDDLLSAYEEMKTPVLRDGYVSKADHDLAVKQAVRDFARELDKDGGKRLRARLSKVSGSPALVQGNNASHTYNWWLGLTLEQRAAERKRDPNIEGKLR